MIEVNLDAGQKVLITFNQGNNSEEEEEEEVKKLKEAYDSIKKAYDKFLEEYQLERLELKAFLDWEPGYTLIGAIQQWAQSEDIEEVKKLKKELEDANRQLDVYRAKQLV